MHLTIQANCNWQKIQERRQKVEQFRQNKVARLRADIDRISKREIEYTKNLIETIVPVRITWDADAWNRIKEFVPVRVEVQADAPVAVDPKDPIN